MTDKRHPATGKGSNRYRRYEVQGLSLTTNQRSKDVGVNDNRKGYSDSDGPAEKAERAQVAYEATVRGFASEEPEGTPEERARERQLTGTNQGIPEHRGFTKEDKARMEKALKADVEHHSEQQ